MRLCIARLFGAYLMPNPTANRQFFDWLITLDTLEGLVISSHGQGSLRYSALAKHIAPRYLAEDCPSLLRPERRRMCVSYGPSAIRPILPCLTRPIRHSAEPLVKWAM
jgi:hypothetical protein